MNEKSSSSVVPKMWGAPLRGVRGQKVWRRFILSFLKGTQSSFQLTFESCNCSFPLVLSVIAYVRAIVVPRILEGGPEWKSLGIPALAQKGLDGGITHYIGR